MDFGCERAFNEILPETYQNQCPDGSRVHVSELQMSRCVQVQPNVCPMLRQRRIQYVYYCSFNRVYLSYLDLELWLILFLSGVYRFR